MSLIKYHRKTFTTFKEIIPHIKSKLVEHGWTLLDEINYDFTHQTVDFTEVAIVVESPSGFIGYIKESYVRSNPINSNEVGLRFNYMDSYYPTLELNNQIGSSSDFNRFFNSNNQSYNLESNLVFSKSLIVFDFFIDDYSIKMNLSFSTYNKNIYFGHYLRYGTDRDIKNPSVVSGSIRSGSSLINVVGNVLNGGSYKDEKGLSSNVNESMNLNNWYKFDINSYSIDGKPILRQCSLNGGVLGEYYGIYYSSASVGKYSNGNILVKDGVEYLFNNSVFYRIDEREVI